MSTSLLHKERSISKEEKGYDINYLEFIGVTSNNRVSGFALGGEVLAVTGDEKIKNELMDILSQNENTSPPQKGKRSYKVSFNDILYDHNHPHPSSTYIDKSHVELALYELMTVHEVLSYADAVRTPVWDSSPTLLPDIVDCLQLQPILQTRIQNLTSVQRYIVLIASEIASKKEVLFLNEPTLNFSISESNDVLRAINDVSRKLRLLVIISITHLSQAHIRSYIDRLLLVSSSGVVYFGRAEEAEQIFQEHTHLGNSYSEALMEILQKNLVEDDSRCSHWNEDDLRQSRHAEGNFSLRTLPMTREVSLSPFTTDPESKQPIGRRVQVDSEKHDYSLVRYICFHIRIVWWLFWRSFIVRYRDNSQLIAQLIYCGISPGGGLAITFSNMEMDLQGGYLKISHKTILIQNQSCYYVFSGFQGLCAFLTVISYGIAILQNTWYVYDIKDWGVYQFERSRLWNPRPVNSQISTSGTSLAAAAASYCDDMSYICYLMSFPIVTVFADMLLMRIHPPVAACILVYFFVNLNNEWHAKVAFFLTIILLSIVGVMICRCVAALTLASAKKSDVQARSSLVSTSLFCFFVLYAGFLLSPSDLPQSKHFIRNWSIYYWVGPCI